MNTQQLRYLVATADLGTMTAAARELHVAQPALTRAIRSLERELGLVVFERSGRGVVLTAAGRRVVELARHALDDIDAIVALGRAAQDAAVLTLAATQTLQVDLAAGLLARLGARGLPATARFLACRGPADVVAAVRAGTAEVGCCDLPVPADLASVPLAVREVVLFSPPDVDLPDPVDQRLLDGLRLVLPPEGSPRRAEFDAHFGALGVSPVAAVETDERGAWLGAVRSGLASCIWYRDAADADLPGVVVRALDPPIRRTVGLVHRRTRLSPAARMLLDAVRRVSAPGSRSAPPAAPRTPRPRRPAPAADRRASSRATG